MGSVRSLTDSTGSLTNKYDYTAFGEKYTGNTAETVANRYGYTGRENSYLANAGAPMFYRNRMYSPGIGRFLRADPAGYPNNLDGNLYAYCGNTVLALTDPYGLGDGCGGDDTVESFDEYMYELSEAFNDVSIQGEFDGSTLKFTDNYGNSWGEYPATSGRSGETDPAKKGQGPLPEGKYSVDPANVVENGLRTRLNGDWGTHREKLDPSPETNTMGREGFYIHGGSLPGSAGCIDVGSKMSDVAATIKSQPGPVPVNVKYPEGGAPKKFNPAYNE